MNKKKNSHKNGVSFPIEGFLASVQNSPLFFQDQWGKEKSFFSHDIRSLRGSTSSSRHIEFPFLFSNGMVGPEMDPFQVIGFVCLPALVTVGWLHNAALLSVMIMVPIRHCPWQERQQRKKKQFHLRNFWPLAPIKTPRILPQGIICWLLAALRRNFRVSHFASGKKMIEEITVLFRRFLSYFPLPSF